jgi:hypothetical protein
MKFLEKLMLYNILMANIFIKANESNQNVLNYLESYIRKLTVHNVSIFEKNADICINLTNTEESLPYGLSFNSINLIEVFYQKIQEEFSFNDLKIRPLQKMKIASVQYDEMFECPTLTFSTTKNGRTVDEELFGTLLGQAIVKTFDESASFEKYSVKDKKDSTAKRSQDKTFSDRKFIQEPTSNSRLLFKK